MLQNLILVGLGGFIGSVARYLIYLATKSFVSTNFPLATLIVNVVGCFLIGSISSWIDKNQTFSQLQIFVSVGIIGGFTTFSAFGLETATLLRDRLAGVAFLSVLLSLILGIGAVFLGRRIF